MNRRHSSKYYTNAMETLERLKARNCRVIYIKPKKHICYKNTSNKIYKIIERDTE